MHESSPSTTEGHADWNRIFEVLRPPSRDRIQFLRTGHQIQIGDFAWASPCYPKDKEGMVHLTGYNEKLLNIWYADFELSEVRYVGAKPTTFPDGKNPLSGQTTNSFTHALLWSAQTLLHAALALVEITAHPEGESSEVWKTEEREGLTMRRRQRGQASPVPSRICGISKLAVISRMQPATPEQIKRVRHRRKVLMVVWLAFMGGFFASMMVPYLLDLHLSSIAIGLRAFYFIGGGLFLVVFSSLYSRCPVCKSAFTRQSDFKYCEKCGIKYDA